MRVSHTGQDSTGNPDHLEPIPALDANNYNQAVFSSLIQDVQPQLWMIVKPSFSPEYGLLLVHEVEYASDDMVHRPKWATQAELANHLGKMVDFYPSDAGYKIIKHFSSPDRVNYVKNGETVSWPKDVPASLTRATTPGHLAWSQLQVQTPGDQPSFKRR